MSINKTHGKNKDKYLNKNGANEVSAEDIKLHLDSPEDLNLKANKDDLDALELLVDTKQDILGTAYNVDGLLLMTNANGFDGDTTLVDVSNTDSIITFFGNAMLSDLEKKFGSTSIYLDGSLTSLYEQSSMVEFDVITSHPYYKIFQFFEDAWTIDLWFKRVDGVEGNYVLIGSYNRHNPAYNTWRINLTNNLIQFNIHFANWNDLDISVPIDTTDTNWHHVAVVKAAHTSLTSVGLYLDGNRIGKHTSEGEDSIEGALYIGADGTKAYRTSHTLQPFKGYIDEIRIDKSDVFNVVDEFGNFASSFVVPNIEFNINDAQPKVGIIDNDGTIQRSDVSIAYVANIVNGELLKLTTDERDTLTLVNGMIIYNTTLNKVQGYENNIWVNLI